MVIGLKIDRVEKKSDKALYKSAAAEANVESFTDHLPLSIESKIIDIVYRYGAYGPTGRQGVPGPMGIQGPPGIGFSSYEDVRKRDAAWDIVHLHTIGKLSLQEYLRIYEMIYSPDTENLVLAEELIKTMM